MIRAAALVVAAGLLGACGAQERPAQERPARYQAPTRATPTASAPTPAAPTPAAAARSVRTGTTVISAPSRYGRMLYDAGGQPIYLFEREKRRTPRCYGSCAQAWPPVYTRGLPRARAGVRQSLLGTTKRRDGRLQATYAGHPLYFYAHEGPYQVTCHDVTEYGGTWLAVRPDGEPVPG